MAACVIGIGQPVRRRVGRMVHAEPPEDVVADKLLPGLAAHLLDKFPGRHVEDVVIRIGATKARRGLDVAEAPYRLLARQIAARNEEQVARSETEAAAVNEQIAN